jgi:uncharacterized membrane-anchored protein YhcB (DUF1043 family)|tara:strand:+ start:276 stop:491 length:216 start_codon:yes stop_codon:yes gene_type:complete
MDLTILGWVWIGIFIGVIIGIVGTSIKLSKQITDLESELQDSRVVRDSLKAYILKLENQPKPKPRKHRRRK